MAFGWGESRHPWMLDKFSADALLHRPLSFVTSADFASYLCGVTPQKFVSVRRV